MSLPITIVPKNMILSHWTWSLFPPQYIFLAVTPILTQVETHSMEILELG